jgi:hypothetical protein
MAYDIARGKQIPRNLAINLPARPASRNELLVLGGSAVLLLHDLLKRIRISADQQEHQRRFRPGMKKTIEMPAMPMRELTAIPYSE